ncbi:hypothetical protein [Streptomyces virginiae]|uniref:hypothetical protein n=1 Tax=Streptomyces virginiae TaxID=1961 RepID=UPI0036619B65
MAVPPRTYERDGCHPHGPACARRPSPCRVPQYQHLPNEINLAAADSVFKYARGFATGKYGGNQWPDDLIVRWSDGEVTKYTDIDAAGLHAEEQLAAPNDLWKTANLITGGDLDGDSNGATPNHDLLVVWASGKVSVFPDVNTGRLQNESVVASSPTWTYARVIALGECGMNDWEDDLFVRWSDGKVTVYGNTQADGVGREYQLVPPGKAGFAAAANGAVRPDDPCAKVCGPELYRRNHCILPAASLGREPPPHEPRTLPCAYRIPRRPGCRHRSCWMHRAGGGPCP